MSSPNLQVLLPQEWPGALYYDQDELDAVTRVIKARSPFRFYGERPQQEADQFENEFAKHIGTEHCLGVSSGTAALQIALAAMGVGPGDEVLVPGYFWVSTVGAVVRSGAVPGLVDVDESFSMDPLDLRSKISERTKAVIIVHMGGVIGQVEKIVDICRDNGLFLLEDCAQATGAGKFGKMAGSFGDMGIFSFQLNKNITAGEGGAIVTNSRELYNKSFAIHDLGYYRNEKGRLNFDDPDGQLWGIGSRMNEITAAIMRVQLKKIDTILGSMREFKNELKSELKSWPWLKTRFVEDPEGDGGAFLKLIFPDRHISIDFIEGIMKRGISVKEGGGYPVHMTDWGLHIYSNIPSLVNKRSICGHHPVWELAENSWAKEREYSIGTLPVLDSYVERTVIFCIASRLENEQKNGIKKVFTDTCETINNIHNLLDHG
ncbi:MAG: DegT/DnrJ/EryC1/StrS family aminotransferase [Bacteroidales bacterium]|nr:DegT/DnrJ/EryC1/StrS family aminotransferase [Bacteroidales bacterium]